MDATATTPTYPTGSDPYGPGQSRTLTLGDWLITYLIMAVPLVNIIMLFVWAFGSGTPPSKANWAKALLILGLIATILGILFAGSFMALMRNNPNFH